MAEIKQRFDLKTYKLVGGKPDIRRFVLDGNSGKAYGDLMAKLSRAYKKDPDHLQVYWKDSENDFVSLESEEDLQVASNFANGSLLKLFVVNIGDLHVIEEFAEGVTPKANVDSQKNHEETTDGVPRYNVGVHHPFVTCDGCQSKVIYGRRFKCLECADYDLCERCELVHNRHPEHNMMLIRRPSPSGCPFMFNDRQRVFNKCQRYPGCPVGRGPHCGRFWQAQAKQAEQAPPSSAEQPSNTETMEMRLDDMLEHAQNGDMDTIIKAVNEVLRPLGADLSVQVDTPVDRSDMATTTEKGSTGCADSSEQAGSTLGNGSEQAIQTQPSTCIVSTETARVEKIDVPVCTESQRTVNVSTSTLTNTGVALQQLLEMGFTNENGWLELLVEAKKANVPEILDILVTKYPY